jgi:hypothetical protein
MMTAQEFATQWVPVIFAMVLALLFAVLALRWHMQLGVARISATALNAHVQEVQVTNQDYVEKLNRLLNIQRAELCAAIERGEALTPPETQDPSGMLPESWHDRLAEGLRRMSAASKGRESVKVAEVGLALQLVEGASLPRRAMGLGTNLWERRLRLLRALEEVEHNHTTLADALRNGDLNLVYQVAGRLEAYYPEADETAAWRAAAAVLTAKLAQEDVRVDVPLLLRPIGGRRVDVERGRETDLDELEAVRLRISGWGSQMARLAQENEVVPIDCVSAGWRSQKDERQPAVIIWDASWQRAEG